MDNFNIKKFLKDQYLAEGSCGYTPDGKPRSKPAGPDLMKESPDQEYAIDDLRNIVDDIEQKSDEAREIVRTYFPNELSRLDGYGAFSNMYSANRFDVTLGGFIDRLEEEGYEIEDGVAYVNEGHMMKGDDLDVGHIDNEPHMLKKELARAGQMIQMLYRAVDKYDGQGEVDFPQWWQKKIIQANAMLDSAFDYIDGEEMVAKIDAMIDNMDAVEVDIDVVSEEEDVKKRLGAEKAISQTLKDEGGAAGLEPLVKAVKKFGFNKAELIKLLKKVVKVKKHKDGDYILTPIQEGPGATLGPGPKASKDGVKDNTYVKQFAYKLVPKKIKGSGMIVKQLFR